MLAKERNAYDGVAIISTEAMIGTLLVSFIFKNALVVQQVCQRSGDQG